MNSDRMFRDVSLELVEKKAMLVKKIDTSQYFLTDPAQLPALPTEDYKIVEEIENVPKVIFSALEKPRTLLEIDEMLSSEQLKAAKYAGEIIKIASQLPKGELERAKEEKRRADEVRMRYRKLR